MIRIEMYMISSKEINEIVNSSGKVRGAALCTDAGYIQQRGGEEMLKRVEEVTNEMGYPIDYRKVNRMEWYPVGLRTVSLLAITKALGWDDEQLKEMGRSAPKHSVITKFMLRYLVSVETLAERLQDYWRHNYDKGFLQGIVIGRMSFLCLSDFLLHPILSTYLQGYFVGVLGMVIGKEKLIRVRRTDQWHASNKCYDFILSW